jgi:hypothetical protein
METFDFVRYLDLRKRVERRRRIYAIADRLTDRLLRKYGDAGRARIACVAQMVSTARREVPPRNHIWCQVNRRLK